jgi:hypothetical protein
MLGSDAGIQEAKPMVTTITGIIPRITSSFRLAAVSVPAVAAAVLIIGAAGPAGATRLRREPGFLRRGSIAPISTGTTGPHGASR